MSKVITAATVVSYSLIASKSDAVLDSTISQWINATLDALAASGVARDKSGGEAARRKVRSLLVEACLASERVWNEEHACERRMLVKVRKELTEQSKKSPMTVIEAVLGPSRKSSWYAYLSGVSRAYVAGTAWTKSSHRGEATTTSADKAATPTEVTDTTASVKTDKKSRTVTVRTGAKCAVAVEDVETIISALVLDPGRVALALAYVKAQGWIK